MIKHITVKCVLGLREPLRSLLCRRRLSLCLACKVQSMNLRCVTQREKKKTWKMPYFCITADSSIVWAFSWGAETVSEISSEFALHMGEGGGWVCSIISWNSVITLIVWSAKQTLCVTVQLQTHTHTCKGRDGLDGCMQMRHVCQNKGMWVKRKWGMGNESAVI